MILNPLKAIAYLSCFGIAGTSALQASAVTTSTSTPPPPPKSSPYHEAKTEFYSSDTFKKKEIGEAKKWFKKRGFLENFQTYHEAKDFFTRKGYLKSVDSNFSGCFSFAREGEDVNQKDFHDVIIALHLSDFVYRIGKLRKTTEELAYSDEELKTEVLIGNSFENARAAEKEEMVKLMQGSFSFDKENVQESPPRINLEHLEDVMKHKSYRGFSKGCSHELAVSAIHSMKNNNVVMHKFDAKYNKKNLVYAIAGRKRESNEGSDPDSTDLFISFRGSVTSRDWFQNVQAPLVDITLRYDDQSGKCWMIEQLSYQYIEIEKDLHDQLLKETEEVGEPIRIHRGFLGYLFADYGEGKREKDRSMYANIRNDIELLLNRKDITTNHLYVTGHSLGGALATLASFFLACDITINGNQSPDFHGVKCISFAAPLVGNISFQRAFDVLQQHQKDKAKDFVQLKHFRFTNNRDMVPLAPFFTRYRHTAGTHVALKRGRFFGHGHIGKPAIREERPQRRMGRMIPHPTSLISGFLATSRKFLGCIMTTIPIALLVPFVLVRPLITMLPPIWRLKNFCLRAFPFLESVPTLLGEWSLYQKLPLLTIPLLSVQYLAMKKNTSVMERSFMFGLAPIMFSVAHYIINVNTYKYTAQYWEVWFVMATVFLQFGMWFVRNPKEVFAFKTHSLSNYYDHLRPHHKFLSSTEAVTSKKTN